MSEFRKFLEADEPPAGPAGAGGMEPIPGGMGGPPLPMGDVGMGGPMGGGADPMGGGPMGMGGMDAPPAAPEKTLEIKPIDVWELLEKILGMKKDAQDDESNSEDNLEDEAFPR